ncbi:hypothetical protein [Nocardioides sp. InS609-2]|uniref:hypothetical protein n=1 Tax=Nocardioides sp. InS609-2 TaxID=2760705 RepID=UPI0020BE67C9|nr:hypothetical protein [Nocardioides sp. InS609-2]
MIRGIREAALASLTCLTLTTVAGLAAMSSTAAAEVRAVTPTYAAAAARQKVPALPGGGREVFGHHGFLVAYYGTANTGSLGVLGETDPDTMHARLTSAAKPFKKKGERIQPVYELIVTVADGPTVPGTDGDYSHDILHSLVQRYIDAAHAHNALLLLDIQPGRSDFLTVAKRWQWALEDPWVGLALDPEWRMGSDEVPGQTIGQVSAAEINEVSGWLNTLTKSNELPEKVFMVHQFQSGMIGGVNAIKKRGDLAEVLHIDGFGSPAQKLATYSSLAKPKKFSMGFKLFYDEDEPRMKARAVRKIKPGVSFVSFQ